DHVKLDVPLADLAVHEPDYKRLIAFLKAMEFNTLTRRVAEFSSVDAAEIEPNAEVGPGARPVDRRTAEEGTKQATARPAPTAAATPMLPLEGGAMKLKERPKGPGQEALSPQALVSTRLDAGRKAKVDRARYETVRTLKRLNEWIARAIDLGVVAIDTQATSIDPMQTALVGFSLALAPNEACYVPLAHRQGGDGAGANGNTNSLFAGEVAPDQISERDALEAMRPLLEDAGVLKVGQDLKFDLQMFALRGITLAPYDDVMLLSYVLDAGRSGHGIDTLA